MRKYKERFLIDKLKYSILTIIVLLIVIFFLSKGIFNMYKKYKFTELVHLSTEQQKIEAQNKLDQNQIKLNNIKSEDGKENYIRETYSVKKEGEGMIVVYDTAASTYEIPKAPSNWEAFKTYVVGMLKKLLGFF